MTDSHPFSRIVRLAAVLLAAISLLDLPQASGQVLRYSFDGTVSSVLPGNNGPWDSASPGDPIHVEFQVERDAPPTVLFLKDAEYIDILDGFVVTIGAVSSSAWDSGDVVVKDDDVFNSSCTDRFSWIARGEALGSPAFADVEISISATEAFGGCPALAGSLDLPVALGALPDPAQNASNFTLFGTSLGGGAGVVIEGTVTLSAITLDFSSSCFGDGGLSPGCTPCPCGNNAPGPVGGCSNSFGASAELKLAGLPSLTADSLTARMTGGTATSFAILTSGAALAPTNPNSPCFGLPSGIGAASLDGLRCAVQGVQRHGVEVTRSDGSVTAWPSGFLAPSGFVAGQQRFFQAVYREGIAVGCGTGLNTTQAVSVMLVP